jgi:D-alanyl-D-alanine carboxypeptidase/D-alanyl-D-alanine-endopeptidase (penicillin-binding protein 4)
VIFTKALQSAGITVQGPSRTGAAATGARVLATIDGPPLIELVAAMGTWSDNYIAEVTLKLLGLRIAGEGSSAAGSRVVTQHLAKLGVALNGATIADGSGLSLDDRISARTLAQILAVGLRSSPNGPALRDALALGGVTGTLRRRLSTGAAAGIVRGKTGTTDLSSALAGYVGDRWAFAVISNGSPVDHWAAHALQDRVVQTLAELRR